MPSRKEIKTEARMAMKHSIPSIYIVTLVYIFMLIAFEVLNAGVSYSGMDFDKLFNAYYSQDMDTVVAIMSAQSSTLGSLISILLQIFSSVIGCGFMLGCLNASRHISSGIGVLFDGFPIFFKLLWLLILEYIYTFLWSLLLIVPGIIAKYRYSMAVYIMLDNPELSASECIQRSKEMMSGKKWTLFVQHLSFILWDILSVIPFVSVFVMPYIETSNAVFYNYNSGEQHGEYEDSRKEEF